MPRTQGLGGWKGCADALREYREVPCSTLIELGVGELAERIDRGCLVDLSDTCPKIANPVGKGHPCSYRVSARAHKLRGRSSDCGEPNQGKEAIADAQEWQSS